MKELPEELRENIWQQLDSMRGFHVDFFFNCDKKGVYVKGDNLLSWNAFVVDELYESNWQNMRKLGFELTATLEVRYLVSFGFEHEVWDWVPEWCFPDVEDALYEKLYVPRLHLTGDPLSILPSCTPSTSNPETPPPGLLAASPCSTSTSATPWAVSALRSLLSASSRLNGV